MCEGFQYIGNCTDRHSAPHLQDMMDAARQITYRTFVQAVGLDSMRDIFGDYSWGYQRGDLRMKNDPYVTYYRSTFDGRPCYYVRHSGIEYIFSEPKGDDEEASTIPISANRFSILGDGALLASIKNGAGATFYGTKTPNSLDVTTTSAPSAKAAMTLLRMIRQSKLETIQMDGEEEASKDVMRWLRKFIK
jgi:hypothetical protein